MFWNLVFCYYWSISVVYIDMTLLMIHSLVFFPSPFLNKYVVYIRIGITRLLASRSCRPCCWWHFGFPRRPFFELVLAIPQAPTYAFMQILTLVLILFVCKVRRYNADVCVCEPSARLRDPSRGTPRPPHRPLLLSRPGSFFWPRPSQPLPYPRGSSSATCQDQPFLSPGSLIKPHQRF